MTRPARIAAAALSAALAFGVAAPATAAAPAESPRKVRVTKEAKVSKEAKASKEARRLVAQQKKVEREIARKDTALVRVLRSAGLATLDPAQTETIEAGVAADRALLAGLRESLAATVTLAEVRAVAVEVAAVRPQVYRIVIAWVRLANEFAAAVASNTSAIGDLSAQADAKEAEGFDVTDVRVALDTAAAANAQAATAAEAAGQLAVVLTATATRADLTEVRIQLSTAGDALDTVAEQLAVAEDALALLVPAEPTV